jgi:hypothetical protein
MENRTVSIRLRARLEMSGFGIRQPLNGLAM